MAKKFSFNVDRLNSYNYCPAKFKLELPHSVGAKKNPSKIYGEFDVYRKMFHTWCRYKHNKSRLTFKMKEFVDTYEKHLFPEGRSLSSEVMLAYQQKIFEKLQHHISDDASFEYPGLLSVDYNDQYQYELQIDMSYVVNNNDGNWNKRIYGFVILVPEENWNPIDLSNKFERAIIAKYIYPKLREEYAKESSYEIVYFNPKNGKSYTIQGLNDSKGLSADLKRMEYICSRILERDFVKRPVNALCKKCLMRYKCMPRDYGKGAETILAEPLELK